MNPAIAQETSTQIGNDFTAEQWTKLTRAQQIAKCREFAAEAQKLALFVNPQLRRPYNDIARQWLNLADEIEHFRDNSN